MKLRIFLSSTRLDLAEYRRAVIAAIRKAGFDCEAMEDWGTDEREPTTFSKEILATSNAMVLLVAYRRGFVPSGAVRSITQMEYDYAIEKSIDVLPFVLSDGAEWPSDWDERSTDPMLMEWHRELRSKHGVPDDEFDGNVQTLATNVVSALTNWLSRQKAPHHIAQDLWLPRLPEDLREIRLVNLCLTTPPPITENLCRTSNGTFVIVLWDSQVAKYRWYPVSQEYAREKAEPVREYRNLPDWLLLFDPISSIENINAEPAAKTQPAYELRRKFIEELIKVGPLPAQFVGQPEKLGKTIDSLEQIADMLLKHSMNSTNTAIVQAAHDAVRGAIMGAVAEKDEVDQQFAMKVVKYIFDRLELVEGTDAAEKLRTQVYICYSSQDLPIAEKLSKTLLLNGHRVWFDKFQMHPGDSLREKLEESIGDSAWFIVVLSRSSANSQWCTHELSVALDLELRDSKLRVIPILIDDIDIPILLRDRVYADFRNEKLEAGLRQIADLLTRT